jgi:hypothetical protein
MITDGRAKGWWPRGENIWIGPMPSLPGVRSPPLHKMANRCDGRLRGKPGDGAEGGFLGGARSPRPRCKAELAPWHSISARWGRERRVAYRGYVSLKPEVSFTGVRSPPLRGVDHPSWDGLAVEGQGMTRGAVFSEGRTLCARIARPYSCQGFSSREMAG